MSSPPLILKNPVYSRWEYYLPLQMATLVVGVASRCCHRSVAKVFIPHTIPARDFQLFDVVSVETVVHQVVQFAHIPRPQHSCWRCCIASTFRDDIQTVTGEKELLQFPRTWSWPRSTSDYTPTFVIVVVVVVVVVVAVIVPTLTHHDTRMYECWLIVVWDFQRNLLVVVQRHIKINTYTNSIVSNTATEITFFSCCCCGCCWSCCGCCHGSCGCCCCCCYPGQRDHSCAKESHSCLILFLWGYYNTNLNPASTTGISCCSLNPVWALSCCLTSKTLLLGYCTYVARPQDKRTGFVQNHIKINMYTHCIVSNTATDVSFQGSTFISTTTTITLP